jgi:predicted tellurium resistance membrane protein TerC
MDIAGLVNSANIVTLITLALLEIVLGIDNVIFIAILSGRLPANQQKSGRQLGLMMALLTRILLLLSLTWIMRLVAPLFTVVGNEISGRDLILLIGGLFLIVKSTMEMHHSLEGTDTHVGGATKNISFWGTIAQIAVLDIVFSLDSVITAVGLSNEVAVMVVAIVIAVLVMLAFSEALSRYIEKHPTIKILALSFLSLIGMSLVAEGLDFHIEKGYIYFAMAFSVVVELINIRMRASQPVKLHSIVESEEPHS